MKALEIRGVIYWSVLIYGDSAKYLENGINFLALVNMVVIKLKVWE